MTSPSIDITFYVPCYNEQDKVVPTVETVIKAVSGRPLSYEVLVFNDGSTDRSAENVRAFLKDHPDAPVTLIDYLVNRGPGTNYLTGAYMARGRYYMMVCGDNDTPLETMNQMLDVVGKADIIVPYIADMHARPLGRRVLSRTFTWLVGAISGSRLRYYNGIVIHKADTVRRFAPRASGFAYQAEILCQAVGAGCSFLQIPIRTLAQAGFLNTSAFRLRNIVSVAGSLWQIFWDRKYHCRPERRNEVSG